MMMNGSRFNSLIAASGLAVLLLAAGPAWADITTWGANLEGSVSTATGTATIVQNSDLAGQPGYWTLTAEYFGLSGPVTEALFFSGDPSSGGSSFWAVGTDNPLEEDLWFPLNITAIFTQAIGNENLYLNVVTEAYPAGEIWGRFIFLGTVDNEVSSWGDIKVLFR
jgi:hypothetical protein